ncbi:uncharacterized protein KY384_003325 [Bacidia gigantensis]|uniref:uncharacterized protein n=1 Tax=Bacidia gigantensis TaxID=2732470 RepID=UPI001D052A72|nr:uncharacterized protein KY384_003325 [Bacidia gigantensis]KAG8531693.1 hypothetical protein KY384_003325 [Bacidia gigantensis]
MFAVPGWSVDPSTLKTQTVPKSSKSGKNGSQAQTAKAQKSKKRKRESHGPEVTQENVGDLYKKLIEENVKKTDLSTADEQIEERKSQKKQKRKRNKKEAKVDGELKESQPSIAASSATAEAPSADGNSRKKQINGNKEPPRTHNPTQQSNPSKNPTPDPKTKNQKPDKRHNPHSQPHLPPSSSLPQNSPTTSSIPAPVPPPQAKLTPLQQKMHQKLLSARFRHLNQTLYTTPSIAAATLFSSDPTAYSTYHSGFRAQVASWPSNPLEGFVEEFRVRNSLQSGRDRKGRKKGGESGEKKGKDMSLGQALPRDHKSNLCRVIDLGCGDAQLSSSLQTLKHSKSKPGIKVRSFDFQLPEGPTSSLVEKADITNLKAVGVQEGGTDIAVCCLSLMGTNWVKAVDEVGRVLVRGGEAWVAEVRSRFRGKEEVERMRREREEKKVGKKKGKKRKGGDEEDEVEEGPGILEEIEGGKGEGEGEGEGEGKDAIDVGAFVEVWKRRGFELKGKPDLGNKMFVKMQFVKVGQVPSGRSRGDGDREDQKKRFIDKDEPAFDPVEEGKVLKPCVYKTR